MNEEQAHEVHGRRMRPGGKLEIRVADPAPGDHFASHRRGPCRDSEDARWPEHDYSWVGLARPTCRRCGKVQRMEPL